MPATVSDLYRIVCGYQTSKFDISRRGTGSSVFATMGERGHDDRGHQRRGERGKSGNASSAKGNKGGKLKTGDKKKVGKSLKTIYLLLQMEG